MPTLPQVGMVATVRNRRGVISSVQPFDGPAGRLHMVDLEYNDGFSPREESLLWEREPFARVLPPAALPDPTTADPMSREDLLALIRACRWSARMPFIDPDMDGPLDRLPVSSPFHSAVQVEDYQLIPLLKALKMPRVSLLIADDVGLGKTIEAGLILSELLLRRRIRRVLILTPASLRSQWRDELWDKFSLTFDIVDRDSTTELRRELGLDANPWRSFSRIITSYHYLKQPDVLENFRAASHTDPNQPQLPWDLLIVDEAHNMTPTPIGEESDLCTMLRQVAPLFEHRIFLTATPHNGHTRSFTGLLEMLDPVRFSQTNELKPAERARIGDVLIRRLKREINDRTTPKKFCDRLPPEALLLAPKPIERRVSIEFAAFREKVRAIIAQGGKKRRLAGNFAIEILGKRLLSCPTTFAESWHRCRAGMNEETAVTEEEVISAAKTVEEDPGDDREVESRAQAAATTVGAWLRPLVADLSKVIAEIDGALVKLCLTSEAAQPMPVEDERYRVLRILIDQRIREKNKWRDDERLVIFTEYKTTLDYLLRRLRADYGDASGAGVPGSGHDRILTLYGGMDGAERDEIKGAFNDPNSAVRILIATDAASEGLNLQETARYLLHYDVPWNPSRVEQRNGRLDRHGQSRDVQTWHFASNDDHDLRYLSYLVEKVNTIREDLGACGEVFDDATHRRLVEGRAFTEAELDQRLEDAQKRADIPRDKSASHADLEQDPAGDLRAIAAELDLDPEAIRTTLDAAMAIAAGRPRITEPDKSGRSQLVQPHPSGWEPVIEDSIRKPTKRGVLGALRSIVFAPDSLVVMIGGRPVFRPSPDTVLVRLAHPMLQRALSTLTRQRFPGSTERSVSRWSLHHGDVPKDTEALLLLTIEELAVNELRETFHHWVRTVRFPIRKGMLGQSLPHLPAGELHRLIHGRSKNVEDAHEIWLEAADDLRAWLKDSEKSLTTKLKEQVDLDRVRAIKDENKRYESRQGEVSALIASSTMARLEREIADLNAQRQQGVLFDADRRLEELDRSIEIREEELKRRRQHYEDVRDQLARERERITKHLIPNRFSMRGSAQIMPIAVEFVFPDKAK